MKNTLFAIALASAGAIAAPAISHAADGSNGGFFINGNVGQSSVDKGFYNDDDTSFGGNIGYRWALSPAVAIGLEGGYTTIGQFDPQSSFTVPGVRRAEIQGWNAGVNGHFNFTPNWYVSARGGWFLGDIKGSVFTTTPGTAVFVDGSSDKYYAGAGFGYDFSNNLSVGLNYDYYKVEKDSLDFNPDVVSVSAEYRF